MVALVIKFIKKILGLKKKSSSHMLRKAKVETFKFTPHLDEKTISCRVCRDRSVKLYDDTLLEKYFVEYYFCEHCGFLQAEDLSWLEEAYKESINREDTGILARNESIRSKLSIILYILFDNEAKFLDYAGGYGFLTRMMRDVGFNFFWADKYTQNITALGFEGDLSKKYDAVTAFEAFEHFENPIEEFENMLRLSKTIIFSTEVLPSFLPKPKEWLYYGLTHGQHISFYTEKTFDYLAKKYQLNYYNIFDLHVFTELELSEKLFRKAPPFKVVKKNMQSKTEVDSESMAQQKSDSNINVSPSS